MKPLASLWSFPRKLVRTLLSQEKRFQLLAQTKGIRLTFGPGAISFHKHRRKLILPAKNAPYICEVIRSFDYYFDSIVAERTPEGEVVDLSSPRKLTLKDEGVAFWMNSLTEPVTAQQAYFERYRPKEGDICFDCGANYGYVTYLMSKWVGEHGRVVSFEPDPETSEVLKRNVEELGLKNVTMVKKALWNEKTTLNFNAEGGLGGGLVKTISRDQSMLNRQIAIPTTTMEDVVRELQLPRLNFIKMDIEGAELEVLESSVKLLSEKKPHVAVASEHLRDGQLTFTRVEQILKKAGYQVVTSDPAELERSKVLVTWGWKPE